MLATRSAPYAPATQVAPVSAQDPGATVVWVGAVQTPVFARPPELAFEPVLVLELLVGLAVLDFVGLFVGLAVLSPPGPKSAVSQATPSRSRSSRGA